MKKIFTVIYLILSISMLLAGATNALGYSSESIGLSSANNLFPMIFFIIMLVYVIIFIVWLAVAYWTYKDAKKRGLEHPVLWGVVVFFAGLIGILIYLVLRNNIKPNNPVRFCTNCGRAIPFDANICPYCAKRFETYF